MESIKMDKKLFGVLMTSLFINYRQRVDFKLIDMFWDKFKNVSAERFRHAIKDIQEIEEYFPTVATINKYLKSFVPSDEIWEWPTIEEFAHKAFKTGQMAKDCLRIMFLKLEEKLSHQEYYEEMLKLDIKYPDRSFKKQAEMFLHKKRDKVLYQKLSRGGATP